MTWFERLTHVRETSPEAVRAGLEVVGTQLRSRANGKSWQCGTLEVVSLGQLRERAAHSPVVGTSTLRELVGDSRELHAQRGHAGAMFQVASQFNLLEMVGPDVTPEHGISGYEHDRTQGPACAIAAGAGTIYRNYFIECGGGVGQTATRQVDTLADVGEALGNGDGSLWSMRNGYALPQRGGLAAVAERLAGLDERERDRLREKLRIGVQWNTEVTLDGCGHLVSQAYCSALPVAYASEPASVWQPFAQLVLEASYEAAFCAARINAAATGNRTLLLTLVGGGAFGNPPAWILDAIERALRLHARSRLDVAIVSYGSQNSALAPLLAEHGA